MINVREHEVLAGLLVLFVCPVIIYYFSIFRGKAFMLYIIISLAFTAGSIELLTGFKGTNVAIICEVLIWSLTIYLYIVTKKRTLPYWPYLALFLFTCFISYLINTVTFIQLLLFLRRYVLLPVVFILFHNLHLPEKTNKDLLKFIVLLFVAQIAVNVTRYPIAGQTEWYIGTMSVLNGSITAIFCLTGIVFSFSAYLYKRKVAYVFLILGFFLFSLIGGKRAQILFIPPILFLQYIKYMRSEKSNIITPKFLKMFFVVIVASCVFIFGGVVLNPSLNPEGVIGGSFDTSYVIEYIDNYLNPGKAILGVEHYGRGEAPHAVFELLTQIYGWHNFLFGLGPGDIIMSRFTVSDAEEYPYEEMIAGVKYDIGYGSRTGVMHTAIQIGLLGTLFYIIFIYKIFSPFLKRQLSKNNKIKNYKIISLGLFAFFFIFVLDFLTYSQVSFQCLPIILSIFVAYNYLFSRRAVPMATYSK